MDIKRGGFLKACRFQSAARQVRSASTIFSLR